MKEKLKYFLNNFIDGYCEVIDKVPELKDDEKKYKEELIGTLMMSASVFLDDKNRRPPYLLGMELAVSTVYSLFPHYQLHSHLAIFRDQQYQYYKLLERIEKSKDDIVRKNPYKKKIEIY